MLFMKNWILCKSLKYFGIVVESNLKARNVSEHIKVYIWYSDIYATTPPSFACLQERGAGGIAVNLRVVLKYRD